MGITEPHNPHPPQNLAKFRRGNSIDMYRADISYHPWLTSSIEFKCAVVDSTDLGGQNIEALSYSMSKSLFVSLRLFPSVKLGG